jgi:hypothetical protein
MLVCEMHPTFRSRSSFCFGSLLSKNPLQQFWFGQRARPAVMPNAGVFRVLWAPTHLSDCGDHATGLFDWHGPI